MRALANAYSRLLELIGLLCGLLVGWVALSITIDVLLRNLSSMLAACAMGWCAWLGGVLRSLGLTSLPWAMEVNEYSIFVVTALGAPWALSRGAHVRVDLVVKGVPTAIGRVMEVTADLVGLASSAGLAYYAWAVASASIRDNARLIKILIIPEWWVFAVVTAGAVLMMIEFVRRLVRAVKEGPHLESAPSV